MGTVVRTAVRTFVGPVRYRLFRCVRTFVRTAVRKFVKTSVRFS